MSDTPKKLKKDAIAEALFEVRFECKESTQLPELVVGKLTDNPSWKSDEKVRLPAAEVPASLRAQDDNLRFQPLLEVRDSKKAFVAKIGANVFSYHRLAPYPGGATFEHEVVQSIDFVFKVLGDVKAIRLGLRYINLFTASDHGVKALADLHQQISVAGIALSSPLNLNYRVQRSPNLEATVKIASPEFVHGKQLKPFVALVDVDVYTPREFSTTSADTVKGWLKEARQFEKDEFFKLFTKEMVARLVEE